MQAIVCADEKWGIGKDGQLLMHLPEDMKFFKETTTGHVVIMGRKTLDSFPGGKPLKDRLNIVLTRDRSFKRPGVLVVHSYNECTRLVQDLIGAGVYAEDDFFVIGGGSIYDLFLKDCRRIYVTRIHAIFDADTYFTNLDLLHDQWGIEYEDNTHEHNGKQFSFMTYKQI